jgi:hypothetical protein
MENPEIVVITADAVVTRAGGSRKIPVQALAEGVESFLQHIAGVVERAPSAVGAFELTELTLSAEVTAQGKLVLLGTGVETGAKGGITFKFERKRTVPKAE